MKTLILFAILCLPVVVFGQVQYAKDTGELVMAPAPAKTGFVGNNDDKVFNMVEHQPEFPGGEQKMVEYLSSNIRYPKAAKKDKVGGTVIVMFVIDKSGEVVDVKIRKGVREDIDKEAFRVVSAMPKWRPGKMNGKNVSVQYNLPIRFRPN